MVEHISYLTYLAGWKIVGVLPEKIAYRLFQRMAVAMYRRNGKSVQRLRTNLAIVKPDLSHLDLELLVLSGLQSYLRYWCDTFRIHHWNPERIEATVSLSNDHLLREPMAQGKGVVIALPHSGNWDHAGAYFCQQGIPLVTVAEILKPEKLFKKFLVYREEMGFEVLGLDSRAFVTLIRRAREKRLIALVADRDLSDSGIPVNFFGHTAKMPAGPAVLAIKEGLPLVAAHVCYTATGIHIDFTEIEIASGDSEEEAVALTVQRIADAFARGIAQSPQDWHMLQRIWIDRELYA
jgi:phosphatidylinositol dimannoside acyltransferase